MSTRKTNRIGFFLGAGTSLSAGMPSTQTITETILKGEGVVKRVDGTYDIIPGKPSNIDWRIPCFFHRLKNLYSKKIIKLSTPFEKFPNYEELYYLASQIFDNTEEYSWNLATDKFVMEMGKELGFNDDFSALRDFSDETIYYLHCMISSLLAKKSVGFDGLRMVLDACKDYGNSPVAIFTLNHDLVIEELLKREGIKYIDGFGPEDKGVRYRNYNLFDKNDTAIKFLNRDLNDKTHHAC